MKTQRKWFLSRLLLVFLLITGCESSSQYPPNLPVSGEIKATVAAEYEVEATLTVDSSKTLSASTEPTWKTQGTEETVVAESEETFPQETVPAGTHLEETTLPDTKPLETVPSETTPASPSGDSGNSTPNDPASCSHRAMKVIESRKPTPEQDGMILIRCGDCGFEQRNELKYTAPKETEPPAETKPPQVGTVADPAEVESFLLKYINQFRAYQGSTQLSYLPGLSNVAKYRSGQLVYDFSHNETAFREATSFYKYGEYVDFAAAGMPDMTGQNYYDPHCGEAIGKGEGIGVEFITAEELGRKMAESYLNSPNHWRYVGSSEYSYIGVGVTFANGSWYNCVLVGTVNYG